MELEDSIPLYKIISGMLLCKRRISCSEISNIMNLFDENGYYIDDDGDSLKLLRNYIYVGYDYSFIELFNGIDYNTIVDGGVSLFNLLNSYTDDYIMDVIKKYDNYQYLYNNNSMKYVRNRPFLLKKKVPLLKKIYSVAVQIH